jgi:hypothetical protein
VCLCSPLACSCLLHPCCQQGRGLPQRCLQCQAAGRRLQSGPSPRMSVWCCTAASSRRSQPCSAIAIVTQQPQLEQATRCSAHHDYRQVHSVVVDGATAEHVGPVQLTASNGAREILHFSALAHGQPGWIQFLGLAITLHGGIRIPAASRSCMRRE